MRRWAETHVTPLLAGFMAVVVVMYLLAVAGIALDLILYVTIAALFVIGVSIFAAVIRRRRP